MSSARKHCPQCGRDKPTTAYHRDRHRPDGLYWCCKQCRRPIQAAAYRRNADARCAYDRAYKAAHREEVNAGARRRYHADLETTRAIQREKAARFRRRHRRRLNREKRDTYARHAVLERALARLRREAAMGRGGV
jgi:hypothetical protein